MKKLLMFLLTLMLVACSAPMPTEDEVVGAEQQALTTCAVSGISGSSTWPQTTVITGVKVAPNYFGHHLIVTYCNVNTEICEGKVFDFADASFHSINGPFVGSIDWPLRSLRITKPGCHAASPSSYCLSMYGDVWAGDHVNELQNAAKFYFEVPTNVDPSDPFSVWGSGSIEAPLGTGIAQFYGSYNALRVKYPNAANSAFDTKYYSINDDACE